jgi:hypothetical protein
MREGSVDMMSRFSNEGVENLKIESKLHCSHFMEVWHLFCWQKLVVLLV